VQTSEAFAGGTLRAPLPDVAARRSPYLFFLGIVFLLSGSVSRAHAQVGPVIRWPVHIIGVGIDHSLLFLQSHNYFKSASDPDDKDNGFHPFLADFGPGAGIGGGARYSRPLPFDTRGTVGGAISTHLYQLYSLRFTRDFGPVRTGPEAEYSYLPQQDFYGEGPESSKSDRTNYLSTERRAGWGTAATFDHIYLRHAISWKRYDISDGTDSGVATTQSVFSPSQVSGGYSGTNWLSNEGGVLLDYRNDKYDPRSGDAFEVSLENSIGLGVTHSNLTTFRMLNTAYIPLSKQRFHLLALRAEVVNNFGNDPVPFYLQPTLGGSQTLRGFHEYRFYDNDALALTAEYRYRIWRYLDAALFADAGQVYNNIWKDIGNFRLNADGGIGLILHAPGGFNARVSAGHSHEGNRLYVSLGTTW
jgi:outer membrane protein assembly factor BamA